MTNQPAAKRMNYRVVPYDPDRDRSSLLDLWRRNLPAASADRHAWLYESGPATGWLLRSAQGAAVGATGCMRRTMRMGDQRWSAGQAIDLNVDPLHRAVGPALSLGRAVVDLVRRRRLRLIYAFPDARSERVLRRIGYRLLGTLGRWAKPLACRNHLPAWLRSPPIAKPASAMGDWLLRLASRETFCRLTPGLQVHVTDHFDARFDALWQRGAARFTILGERTSDYLTWRFGRCPQAVHRVFCLSDADDRLLAYLVYSRRRRVVDVGDFFFADPRHLDRLLAAFLRRMREERAEAVVTVFFGHGPVCRQLQKFGFWKRPTHWKAMLYVDPGQLGPTLAQVLDPESWFLTRADLDTND